MHPKFTSWLESVGDNDDAPSSFLHGVSSALGDLQYLASGESRNLQIGAAVCPFPLLNASPEATNFIDPALLGDAFAALSQGLDVTCAFPCSGTMVNDEGLEFYDQLVKIVAGVSFVLSLFIFLTWGMFWQKARQKMTFWVAFSSVSVTTCIFLPAVIIGDNKEVWCKDDLEPRTQADGFSACVAQGVAIIFFGLSLCCWWFCSCFDIFSKLYRRKRNIQHYLNYYYLFSWSLPTIAAVIIGSTGHFGFEQPRLWCFLEPGAPAFFEFVFFYAWVGVLWVTGTVMMVLVIWSIFAQTRTFNRQGQSATNRQQAKRANYFKKLNLYRTPIIFVLIFSIFWAVFFTFVIVIEVQREDLENDAGLWIACLMVSTVAGRDEGAPPGFLFPDPAFQTNPDIVAATIGGGGAACGDIQPNGISDGLFTTAVLCLAGNGILIFLVFGLQTENYKLWGSMFSDCFCGGDDTRGKKKKLRSTFTEMRITFAMFFIRMCQRLAGQPVSRDESEGLPNSPSRKKPKFDKPLIAHGSDSDYTPQYVQASPSQGVIPASPRQNQFGLPPIAPARTNQNYSPSGIPPAHRGGREDPFPMPNNRYFVDNAPPQQYGQFGGRAPIQTTGFGSRDLDYGEDNMSSAWSDVYNDPLWGINVEF